MQALPGHLLGITATLGKAREEMMFEIIKKNNMSSLKYSRILEAASTYSPTIWPYSRLKKKKRKILRLVASISTQRFLKHVSFPLEYFPSLLNSLLFMLFFELYLKTVIVPPFLKEGILETESAVLEDRLCRW